MRAQKILVAMSGGVDSSVAAALLLEEGHEIAGATIRTWASNTCVNRNTRACCGLIGVEDARRVSEQLGIRYWVFNFEEEFKHHVVDYFAREYFKGRTPNPCIACNEHIKFRLFLKRARQLGFDAIATGHYARLGYDERYQAHTIEEGEDMDKDQSYVLFPLDQDVLSHLHLPVGNYKKSQIREKAKALGLTSVMEKPDSQEICFIPSNDHAAFLEKEFQTEKKEGIIRTRDGKVLGTHTGYYQFTRGQRRGLGIPHTERLYVLETIPETNEVVVGTRSEVLDAEFLVERVNWLLKPPQDESHPTIRASVKIRSQHEKATATIKLLEENTVEVAFDEPQEAVTPGQAAVFYEGRKVLGGGWIGKNVGAQFIAPHEPGVMNHAPTTKSETLKEILRSYGKVLVAFSGGCDSAFILKVSREVLGRENVLAVIAKSPSLPESELIEAKQIADEIGVELLVIETNELENPNYASNPLNRCFFCKSELYSYLKPIADKRGFFYIVNGTNQDDLSDWRPGLKAAYDYEIKSPLVEAGFRKEEIRLASKTLGLSTWSKPQAACLSSRIPFGVDITREKLRQVEHGETVLKELGFEIVRLRWLGERAMIEVGSSETEVFFQNSEVRQRVLLELKRLGFKTIDLNISGYRSGRFNPQLVSQ